jgi:hypothetical protein
MAFIGNQPAESFTSFATQEFSTSATTSYTLDHAVTNENEIALFVNNVRQQPGSGKAYTATGTALTLSAATASTDTMYCVFLGRALQTVTPATNSITSTMLSGNLVTPGTLDVNGNELILDADADTSITADTDDQIDFKTAGSDRMSIISDGKVGINTTSPSEQLHVVGDIKIVPGTSNKAVTIDGPTSSGSTSILINTHAGNSNDRNWSIRNRYSAGGTLEFMRSTDNSGTADQQVFKMDKDGAATFTGSLAKGSGSFKIDHPLDSKKDTHNLVHSFVEAPQADNIYRGRVDLVDGVATINMDTNSGMSEGTFVLLNREVQCFTSNETGWTLVKGSVSGNTLTITAQDNTCTDNISWMVIGERKDKHMYDTQWTDENGKVIVEPLKE